MRYKLVLWDFDGTLADTLSIALQIYNDLAKEKGFKVVTDPVAVRDMNMSEFLKFHGIGLHRIPFVFARFLKEIRKRASDVTLNSGVAQVLHRISELGITQGVVSSNSAENIQLCLQANQAAGYFAVVRGTNRIQGKGSRIKKAIKQMDFVAADVLYVGDEIRDIEAARAAGVDVASVTWGLNSARVLSEQEPTWLISEPEELVELLS